MKRLNCTYEVSKDAQYPWLLKHPKIKSGLAKFKTRQEALEWYMLLNFETAIWFQNEKRIFAGQLTIDNDDKKWFYYIKTAGFDGGATYEGMCEELNINPKKFTHNNDEAAKRLKNLDFVLLHDPNTYFPPELEIAKKERKDVVDVEALRSEIEELKSELQAREEQTAEISLLKEELEKSRIHTSEVEDKVNITEKTIVKTIYEYDLSKAKDTVEYREFINLDSNDYIAALVLYLNKLETVRDNLVETVVSKAEYARIEKNFNDLAHQIVSLNDKEFKNKPYLQKIIEKLNNVETEILNRLTVKEDLNDEPVNNAYYYNKSRSLNIPVSYETSFVLVGLIHAGFVPRSEYSYPIDYVANDFNYGIVVLEKEPTTVTKASVCESKKEECNGCESKCACAENCKCDDKDFWNNQALAQRLDGEANENALVSEKESGWFTFWVIFLLLILIGLVVIATLALLQYFGVGLYFPVN